MSWFDKLFGEDNDSNDDLLRKNKKKRQDNQLKHNNQDSLLPQNNDIYNRPRGKFRFPIQVSEHSSTYDKVEQQEDNDAMYHNSYASSKHVNNYDSTHGADSTGRRHRRRRHTQSEYESARHQPANESRRNNNNNSTRHNHLNRYARHAEQSRIKLQSERLKSSHKSSNKASSDFTYHHNTGFKSSEVPSAIFGTKKRRPIENGVIPPITDGNNEKSDGKTNNDQSFSDSEHQTADVDSVKPSVENGRNTVVQTRLNGGTSPVNKNHVTSSDKSKKENHTYQTKSRTPNYSKRDNTINIENIYASQIVEEIRRERERKVLQKRRFKKALQEKRQQNQSSNEDSIQRAIDEMYAKQAHQYTGESSLDEDVETNHDIDDKTETNKQSNEQSTDFEKDEIGASSFNYEEINLNDSHHLKQINDEEVQVNGTQKNNSLTNQHEKMQQEEIEDAQFQELDDSQQPNINYLSSEESDDSLDKDQSSSQPSYNGAVQMSVDNETEYAKQKQHDKSKSETQSGSNHSLDSYSEHDISNSPLENRHLDGHHHSTLSDKGQDIESSKSIDDNTNVTSNSDTNIKISDLVSEPLQSENDKISNTHHALYTSEMCHTQPNKSQSHIESQSLTDNGSSQNAIERKQQRFGGSQPFNVMMTPSDKKRMMDSKQTLSVHVPELKPEQSYSDQHNEERFISETKGDISSSKNNLDNGVNEQQQDDDIELDENNYSSIEDSEEIHKQYQSSSNHNDYQQKNHSDFHFTNKESDKSNHSNHMNHQTRNDSIKHQYPITQSYQDKSDKTQSIQNQRIRKGPNIKLPSYDLLEEPEPHEVNQEWIEDKKQELNDALYYFNVPAEVKNVTEGPSVTRFELSVEKGVKVSRITVLQDDIKMALAAKDIRIEAPIPGTSLVGIEVPNQNPTKVNLRSIIDTPKFKNTESKLTVAMGYRINNELLLMDIAKTPHALIAGATGSGKSVCINSILMSLLYKNHPEGLRLLLIDPKMVELAPYNDLPHLVSPVITDVKAATQSLKWAVEEMEKRYKFFAQYHVRNITAFNKKAPYEQRMPKIVIVIDELADLMMMAPQDVEQSIARIAQKARACGIHMLVATQRPSVNVITGLIKANIPTRIAFMVSSRVDSKTILDSGGAERLLGYGDMLYLGSGMNKPIRIQGTFVSDDEIDEVVDFIKQQREPEYLFEEKELLKKTQTQARDDLFDEVCEFMVNEGNISTSLIQRHFQIGYNRAARIIDQLEQLGFISGANGSKPRDVYMTEADLNKE